MLVGARRLTVPSSLDVWARRRWAPGGDRAGYVAGLQCHPWPFSWPCRIRGWLVHATAHG